MITQQQFDFLLGFSERSTSGPKYTEPRIDAARKYIFDRKEWEKLKTLRDGRADNSKAYGKKLAEKILFWHDFLTAWPSDIEGKFKALAKTGGKTVSQSTASAAIRYVKTNQAIHHCAVSNGVFSQSVKSALARVKKFDEAAVEYATI